MTNSTGVLNILESWLGSLFYTKDLIYTKTQIDGFNYYNSTDFNINDYYLNSNPFSFYNSSDFNITDYSTTAEAGALYSTIDEPLWTSNQSSYSTTAEVLAFGYYNSTDFVITDYFTKTEIEDFNYYNSTDFSIDDYITSAEVLAFNYYNSTDFSIADYFTSAQVLGFSYYNSTDFVITDYYTKTQIDDFSYYNSTDFSIDDYATNVKVDSLGNFSAYVQPTHLTNFTDDLGDRGYTSNLNFTNDAGYYNSTNPQTETDPLWSSNQSSYSTKTIADTLYYSLSNPFGFYNSTTIPAYSLISNLPSYVGNWSADKSSYWNTSTDLDTVIATDEITELKIDFNTVCGAGNHLYVSGNNLACETDDDTTYTAGVGLELDGTVFGANMTYMNATMDLRDEDTQLTGGQVVTFVGNWSSDKSDYWNSSTDLDGVIDTDEITELKIDFNTVCASGSHLYISGNNLACETDDDTTYTAEEIYIYLDTTTFRFNETKMNATIELLDTDTQLSGAQVVVLVGNWSADKGDYSTTAEAGLLYSTIDEPLWTSNQSSYSTTAEILAFGYYNSTDFVITDYFTKTEIEDFNYYNSTDFDINDYITLAEVLAFNYYNSTDFDINDYFTSAEVLGFNYYNSTDFVITDYYTKTQIDNFDYYNSTDFVISNYYNTTQTDTAIENANTSMKTYVDGAFSPIAEPLSLHLNQDNWENDSNGYMNWDGDSLEFNQSKLEVQFFNATSVLTVTGVESGTLADIQAYDGIFYNVTETASDYELLVNFTGITEFSSLIVRHRSDFDDGHLTVIQIWDYDNSLWEGYGYLSEKLTSEIQTFGVYDDEDHISDGVVQVRFYQDEGAPPTTHLHSFDWVIISKGFGTPVGAEVDPYWSSEKGNYYNTTEILGFDYYNSTDFNITNYSTTAEVLAFGYYNSTDFVITDYFTKTEIEDFNYYNSTDFSISDYFTSAQVLGFSYYNSTDFVITDYYTKTQIDNFNYYNSTDFSISDYATNVKVDSLGNFSAYVQPTHLTNFTDDLGDRGYTSNLNFTNDAGYYNSTTIPAYIETETDPLWTSNQSLVYLNSNPFSFYNSTDFVITDYITLAEVLGFSYYNSTDFSIDDYSLTSALVGLLGNWSADKGDYSTTAEAGALYSTIDEPLWTSNQSSYSTKTVADGLYADISVVSNPFDQELNTASDVEFNNVTVADCIVGGNGASLCFV